MGVGLGVVQRDEGGGREHCAVGMRRGRGLNSASASWHQYSQFSWVDACPDIGHLVGHRTQVAAAPRCFPSSAAISPMSMEATRGKMPRRAKDLLAPRQGEAAGGGAGRRGDAGRFAEPTPVGRAAAPSPAASFRLQCWGTSSKSALTMRFPALAGSSNRTSNATYCKPWPSSARARTEAVACRAAELWSIRGGPRNPRPVTHWPAYGMMAHGAPRAGYGPGALRLPGAAGAHVRTAAMTPCVGTAHWRWRGPFPGARRRLRCYGCRVTQLCERGGAAF